MPTSPTEAWKRGHTLWECAERYAPAKLWNQFIALGGRHSLYDIRVPAVTPELDSSATPNPTSPLSREKSLVDLGWAVMESVVAQLARGTLLAVAFRVPRKRDDKPQWIDKAYWADPAANVSFGEDKLRFLDKATGSPIIFEQVRVIRSRKSPNADGERSSAGQQPGKGRPSYKEMLTASFNRLIVSGIVTRSSTVASLMRPIRKDVREHNSDLPPDALSKSVMYGHISPLLKKFKNG